jgi:hypothetical protein
MYVRDPATNTIYFSDSGYDRAVQGSNVNWSVVVADLLRIAGQSGGMVALGVAGIIWYFVDLSGWAIEFLTGNDD